MPRETLSILFQDDNYIAINKPSGLLVHRSMIDRHETRFAMQILRDQIGQRVYPVHRLDKPTSGVLLFALSSEAARDMAGTFENHQVEKRYIAVVRGHPQAEGLIDHPLKEEPDDYTDALADKDKEAQSAITAYHTLATIELPYPVDRYPLARYALVECQPRTGRKHQIRRHMKHIAHPIIGDTRYGKGTHNRFFRERYQANRLLLHAIELGFTHPYTNQRQMLIAPLDETFIHVLEMFGWLGELRRNREQAHR